MNLGLTIGLIVLFLIISLIIISLIFLWNQKRTGTNKTMITCSDIDTGKDLGDHMFKIAATFSVAKSNKIKYFFKPWIYENYFVNRLPSSNYPIDQNLEEYNPFEIFDLSKKKIYNLKGGRQTKRYFENHEREIRNLFTIKRQEKEFVRNAVPEVSHPNATCIYIYKESDKEVDMNFYNNAIKYIKDNHGDGPIIICSNNIQWCKINFENVILSPFNNQMHDLVLMTLCKHHISSNSSLGWWGAVLSAVQEKTMLFPPGYDDDQYPKNSIVIK